MLNKCQFESKESDARYLDPTTGKSLEPFQSGVKQNVGEKKVRHQVKAA